MNENMRINIIKMIYYGIMMIMCCIIYFYIISKNFIENEAVPLELFVYQPVNRLLFERNTMG